MLDELAEYAKLTKGQKAALTSGKELLTKSQHALCYIVSKDKKALLPQPCNRIDDNYEVFAHGGMNPETGRYCSISYEILIGKRECRGHYDELLFSETTKSLITQNFNEFENLPMSDVIDIVKECLTDENALVGMAKLHALLDKQKHSSTKQKVKKIKQEDAISIEIKHALNGYRALGKISENTEAAVIKRMLVKFPGTTTAAIKSIYKKI